MNDLTSPTNCLGLADCRPGDSRKGYTTGDGQRAPKGIGFPMDQEARWKIGGQGRVNAPPSPNQGKRNLEVI